MLGSIERIWHVLPKRSLVSAMAIVVTVNNPDPTRRATGYSGVVPLPGPAAGAAAAPTHVDPILERQRRDTRAARGRVLYANGRDPHDSTATTRTMTARKGPCPEQRVGQTRADSALPNS